MPSLGIERHVVTKFLERGETPTVGNTPGCAVSPLGLLNQKLDWMALAMSAKHIEIAKDSRQAWVFMTISSYLSHFHIIYGRWIS